ncbi:hypothetical protein Ntsu_68460 [Nocardia sp. IFM 10818]
MVVIAEVVVEILDVVVGVEDRVHQLVLVLTGPVIHTALPLRASAHLEQTTVYRIQRYRCHPEGSPIAARFSANRTHLTRKAPFAVAKGAYVQGWGCSRGGENSAVRGEAPMFLGVRGRSP